MIEVRNEVINENVEKEENVKENYAKGSWWTIIDGFKEKRFWSIWCFQQEMLVKWKKRSRV